MSNPTWKVFLTAGAKKQLQKAGIYVSAINSLINLLKSDPYAVHPFFEKLKGFNNVYSRRINKQHRMVYQILENEHSIKIISVWGHYDDN